jgi:MoxR-like ATPase
VGFASLPEVVQSAQNLTINGDRYLRTAGFWQVLIFLRECRLRNRQTLTLTSFDLAEACFDINGIFLPIQMGSRNVYYEPGAKMGATPAKMFRHREGPRQTFLNRIQTGLSGGVSRPNLFVIDHPQLPITASLHPEWIRELRSNEDQLYILDRRLADLGTWLFRFGVPHMDGSTVSIGVHSRFGQLNVRKGLELAAPSTSAKDFAIALRDFLGITEKQFNELIPEAKNLKLTGWKESRPVGFHELQSGLLQSFTNQFSSKPAITVVSDAATSVTELQDSPVADYIVDWGCVLNGTMKTLISIALMGLEQAALDTIAALKAGKYVILLGPPGTGKTKLASLICEEATDCGIPGHTVATATADWSTFETIGGYTPASDGSGQLVFIENVFTECIRTGRWLVIDELNRADIDKAFGELFTLFSGNKVRLSYRVEGKPIVLVPPGGAIEDESLEFPIFVLEGWRMLGTMNTFDKASLFQMSYAFMRRFAFVEVPIPGKDDYTSLIIAKVTHDLANTQGDVRDQTASYLQAIFTSDSEGTLTAMNLAVGPAIPLDVIEFLRERYLIDADRGVQIDPKRLILTALEMYLYPQFEGRDEAHEQILGAVAKALELDDSERLGTSQVLANWTGKTEADN